MKTILITGATSGIGLAAAKKLANEKNQLILCGRRQRKLDEISEKISKSANVVSLCFDVSNKNEVGIMLENIKEVFGHHPSILINNAMTSYVFNGDDRKNADSISWDEIQNHLNVTLKGSLNLIQGLISDMKSESFGRIINIGTNLVQNPVVPYHDYTIAKAALLGLTRTFAKDLGPAGITVNMLSGGLLKVTDASSATPDFVFDAIAEMTPLQKVTTIEDFSDAALFFASDQSRSITGQNLTVDGGLTFN